MPPSKSRKRGQESENEDQIEDVENPPQTQPIEDIHSSEDEDTETPEPEQTVETTTRWNDWRAKGAGSSDPDSDAACNDNVMPTKLENWMTEREFLDFIIKAMPPGPPTKGFWALVEPAKDRWGLLRVRARHSDYKSGRFNVNTPPFRCRFIEATNTLLVNRKSLQNMLDATSKTMNMEATYPDLFGSEAQQLTSEAATVVPKAKRAKKSASA